MQPCLIDLHLISLVARISSLWLRAGMSCSSYIWNLDNPNYPEMELVPQVTSSRMTRGTKEMTNPVQSAGVSSLWLRPQPRRQPHSHNQRDDATPSNLPTCHLFGPAPPHRTLSRCLSSRRHCHSLAAPRPSPPPPPPPPPLPLPLGSSGPGWRASPHPAPLPLSIAVHPPRRASPPWSPHGWLTQRTDDECSSGDTTRKRVPPPALTCGRAPQSPLCTLEYNPKDQHILIGGSYNGLVAW